MVADKPHAIPMGQSSRSGSSQQGQTSKKASKSNDTGKNARQRQPKPKVQQQPPQQKSKKSGNQKASLQKSSVNTQNKTNSSSSPKQNTQKQNPSPKLAKGKNNSNNNNNNNKNTDRVIIPPRNVQVDFHSKSSNLVTLKDTSDKIRKSAAEVKNLLLSELSINDKQPVTGKNTSPLLNQANMNNINYDLYHQQSLPDGSLPNFGHSSNLSRSSSSCSTANRSKVSSASSYTNDSSNIINAFENLKYAGSSFAAEPKAVTLPKPSFLKSK